MSDQNSTHQGPSRHGGVAPTPNSAEMGSITAVQVDRYTYSVKTARGRTLQGVPRKRSSPSDTAILPVGTSVIVRFDLGIPIIDGVLDMPAEVSDSAGVPTTGIQGYGGQGNNQATNMLTGTFRGANEPTDLLPGDNVLSNHSGARVGVLEGGVALLRGSGAAQVRAYSLNDMVEIISRNFRHVTDMGVYEIRNTDGRVNMSFRGASDQTNEAGANEEHWTIRFDLGSEGDMLDFQLTAPQGQTLFRFHVDSAGRCEIFGLDGVVMQSGNLSNEPHIAEHGGDAVDIVRGDRTVTTGGNITETTEGNHAQTVDGDATTVAGNDARVQAARDYGVSAGRNLFVTAMGAKDGTAAARVEVVGGDYTTVVGQESYPTPSYGVKTYKGNLAFESAMGGKIKLKTPTGEIQAQARKMTFDTNTPDSVILGGNHLVSHLARFEQLEALVKAMMRLFDAHQHPVSGPTAGPSPTPMTPGLTGLLAQVKSSRVGVGG